ncbi:MAG: carboxypeptidase regulatory-like domain-containing protein [Nitrospirae bacterium]|nr:carboxypeptidase regulatory-like domain-containing protein [Nitrospirota bacterium]MBF0591378.1 carboxypeptidase regulatory-like domain-containing protein [Nitrospirota bacterium]
MELKGFLKRRNKRLIVLMAVLLLMLIAGCGGGGSSSTGYTGHIISGTVTLNGAALSGVFVTVQSNGIAAVTTDANGNYSVTNVPNGVYTITASLTGYSFSPSTSLSVVINGADVPGQNFTAAKGGKTNASLSGAYNMVSFDKTLPSVVSGTITFTSGNWTGTGMQMTIGSTQMPTVSGKGTYAVSATESSAGLFTLTPTTALGNTTATASQCIMSDDTNTVVCAKVGDMTDQYSLIAVKAGTSVYSTASLNGTYYMAIFNQSPGSSSQFGTLTCDGYGGFKFAATQGSSSAANQAVSQSGTYTVTATGTATFTPTSGTGMTCGMSADSNTLVCASMASANVQIGVAVKTAGSGYSNASLTGAYYASYLDSLSPFESGWLIGVPDGKGTMINVGVQGNSTGPSQPLTNSVPYSVNANGTFTIGATGSATQCGMSANKNTLVCAEVDKTTEQSILILIK